MSGHSKWSTIKHKKGVADAKRSKEFSQLSRLIRIATKEGGSDNPDHNPTLRTLVDKARAISMPKENIQRAMDRGLGRGSAGLAQEIIYEGFAPNGIPMLIISITDNKQRTSADVRNMLNKAGGSLGGPGSAMYMFQRDDTGEYKATMMMPADEATQEKVQNLIDELSSHDDVEEVYVAAEMGEEVTAE